MNSFSRLVSMVKEEKEKSERNIEARASFLHSLNDAALRIIPDRSFLSVVDGLSPEARGVCAEYVLRFSQEGLPKKLKGGLGFRKSGAGVKRVKSLVDHGLSGLDTLWTFAGVQDCADDTDTRYCAACGRPLRYAYVFNANGFEPLALSLGCASAVFPVDKSEFSGQSFLLQKLVQDLAYIRVLSPATASTYTELCSSLVSKLAGVSSDYEVFSVSFGNLGVISAPGNSRINCVSEAGISGTIAVDWVKDNIHRFVNATLSSDGKIVPCQLKDEDRQLMCMREYWSLARKFLAVGLCIPQRLSQRLLSGLDVMIEHGNKAHANSCQPIGLCGDGVSWSLESDGTLVIAGAGDMWDLEDLSVDKGCSLVDPDRFEPPWNEYRDRIKAVRFVESVESVGVGCFFGLPNLETVNLGFFVKRIGVEAFSLCSKLRKVVLSPVLEEIGEYAFAMSSLPELHLPKSVKVLGRGFIGGCPVESLVVWDDANPSDDCFYSADSLKKVTYFSDHLADSLFWGLARGSTVYCPHPLAQRLIAGKHYIREYTRIVPMDKGVMLAAIGVGADSGDISEVDGLEVVVPTGQCGDNATWTLLSDGTLEITGSGAMWSRDDLLLEMGCLDSDPKRFEHPWEQYRDRITAVRVKDSIDSIGLGCFSGMSNLKSVEIAGSVCEIGIYAFAYCDSLQSVKLSEGLCKIGDFAFAYTSLSDLQLPKSIKYLGRGFLGRSKVKYLVVWADVTPAEDCFYSCGTLEFVTYLSEHVTRGLFKGLAFNSTVYCSPSVAERLVDEEHYSSYITSIVTVGKSELLSRAGVPVSAESSYSGQCGDDLYWELSSAGVLEIRGSGPMWDSKFVSTGDAPGGRTYDSFWASCKGKIRKVVFTGEPSYIGIGAFYDCVSLESVSFERACRLEIGNCAFKRCYSLRSMELGIGVQRLGKCVFENCKSLEHIYIPVGITEIPDYAFACCSSLRSVVLPDGLRRIGSHAFCMCDALLDFCLPDSLFEIADHAFTGCNGFRDMSIPGGVKVIGDFAFSSCDGLTSVNLGAGVEVLSALVFMDSPKLARIDIAWGNAGFKSRDGVVFTNDGSTLLIYPAGRRDRLYLIPDGVVTIGDDAFRGCKYLKILNLTSAISTIGSSAFYQARALESVNIPSSVKVIGVAAFHGCSSLNSVYYHGTESDWAKLCQACNLALPDTVTMSYVPEKVLELSVQKPVSADSSVTDDIDSGLDAMDADAKEAFDRLYAVVSDSYGYFACNLSELRASRPEFSRKRDSAIRFSQLSLVKALNPAAECDLYVKELTSYLPKDYDASPIALRALEDYRSGSLDVASALTVLRAECYNAGLIFTGSGHVCQLLEVLLSDKTRELLIDSSDSFLLSVLTDLLSRYQLMRSDLMTVTRGLYRLAVKEGRDSLAKDFERLWQRISAGNKPERTVDIAGIWDSLLLD